jgi:hypothetical protein
MTARAKNLLQVVVVSVALVGSLVSVTASQGERRPSSRAGASTCSCAMCPFGPGRRSNATQIGLRNENSPSLVAN